MEGPATDDPLQTVVAEGSVVAAGESRGVKRPAEDQAEPENEHHDDDDTLQEDDDGNPEAVAESGGLSKSQLKKLKRQKRYEEKKAYLKEKRKEKRQDRRERKRSERQAEIAAAAAEGRQPVLTHQPKRDPSQRTQVPLTVIVDCQFEKYMLEKELVSLCSQVTRCYSDNRGAQFPAHLFVSSYGGSMKTRFEKDLVNQHQGWKGVHLREGDFLEVAREAKELMASPQGGTTIDLLKKGSEHGDSISIVAPTHESKRSRRNAVPPEPEADDVDKSIVYLTADSPYTIDRLEPNTCYVIGGIIDKNREKGLCYRLAKEKKVRTAKLPIGEFMLLQSRHVLATNHVMDIMLKYLELGDWGEAFMKVIPTRKGGKLRDGDDDATTEVGQDELREAGENDDEDNNGEDGPGDGEKTPEDPTPQDRAHPKEDGLSSDGPQENGASYHQPAEVEGANAEEGLQKNALGEKEWSAPPVEAEKVVDASNAPQTP